MKDGRANANVEPYDIAAESLTALDNSARRDLADPYRGPFPAGFLPVYPMNASRRPITGVFCTAFSVAEPVL